MDLILPEHFPIKHPRSFPTIYEIKMKLEKDIAIGLKKGIKYGACHPHVREASD